MMNPEALLEKCTCTGIKKPHTMCAGPYRLDEKGVKVELNPRQRERVNLIVMDGCYCKAPGQKCDAVYLVHGAAQKFVVAVELKGTNLEMAVKQLAHTRHRTEYKTLVTQFASSEPTHYKVIHRSFVISHVPLGARKTEALSRQYSITFSHLVSAKGTGKVIDLRAHL